MRSYLYYFQLTLLSIGLLSVLCTPFAGDTSLADGLVTAKAAWLHLSTSILAIAALLSCIPGKKGKNLRPFGWEKSKWADITIVAFLGVILVTYDWKLNPEPVRLLAICQLVILWFVLRIIYTRFPELKNFTIAVLILTAGIEAWIGLGQLFGWKNSNHSIFQLTGSFFNPGPYSGYLAILLPLCFNCMLCFRNAKRWSRKNILCILCGIVCLLILFILPAGMSRTAWISAFVGCAYVSWMHCSKLRELHYNFRKNHRRLSTVIYTALVFLSLFAYSFVHNMKKDSADGRFLIWSTTSQAILEPPAYGLGQGLGGFPAAYANAQSISSISFDDQDNKVAGCPEYAFNEYLELIVETGIIGASIFVTWLMICIGHSINHKRIGLTGSILAFSIFCMASYPLHLPGLGMLLIVLCSLACTPRTRQDREVILKSISFNKDIRLETIKEYKLSNLSYLFFFCALLTSIISVTIFLEQKGYYKAYKKWNQVKMLYNAHAYEKAVEEYTTIYPLLNHRPEFLFELAQSLNKTGQYSQAKEELERATKLSSDPMIWYMLAKNEQALGKYEQAENHLLHGIKILPNRIYPWYMLTKLYAEPDFYHWKNLEEAAQTILKITPKVPSSAVEEMQKETKELVVQLEKKEIIYTIDLAKQYMDSTKYSTPNTYELSKEIYENSIKKLKKLEASESTQK